MLTRTSAVDQREALAQAPRIPGDRFISRLEWRQGEHVGLIGPTGQGKTTLLQALLKERTYVTIFATKPRDDSMDRLLTRGYMKFDQWTHIPAAKVPRRVIWPDATSLNSEETQTRVFKHAIGEIYREGGWG